MGWLSRRAETVAAIESGLFSSQGPGYSPTPLRGRNPHVTLPSSPWQVGNLNPLLWYDLFGTEMPFISRHEAMSVPGVHKGRSVLLSLIADKPLVAWRGTERVTPQPRWLQWTSGQVPPWQRMAWTLDDLIFFGWSLWGVTRGEASAGMRPVIDAWRIPIDDWHFDANERVLVRNLDTGDFEPVDASAVILFQGPCAGILAHGSRTLRGAAELEQAWIKRAKNPIPAIDLHHTVDEQLDESEAQQVVDDWAQARSDPNGAVAFTPYNIEARALGQLSPDLFIQGRNFVRLDIAAFFGLPGSVLDASLSTASLTYSTQEGQAAEIYTVALPYWLRPVEARLSQDDVVPQGQSVKFDLSSVAPAAPQPPIITED